MTALHVDLTGCHEIHATIRASNFKEIVILDKIKQAISYIIRLIQFCICFTDLIMIFFLSNRFNFTSIEIHSLYVIQVETCRLVYRWSLSIGGRARASNSVAAAGPADSRVFRDARLERELKSNAPWGERRWLATRLDSARLPSTPLDSTRPGPNHRRPHSQWRRPALSTFLPRPRRGFATWSIQTLHRYTCAWTYRLPRMPRTPRRIFQPLLTSFLSFLSSILPRLGFMVDSFLLLSLRRFLVDCFAPSDLPLARTRPRGYARA